MTGTAAAPLDGRATAAPAGLAAGSDRPAAGPSGVSPVRLRWERREPPLAVAAVIGVGAAAGALAAALSRRADDARGIRVAGDGEVLIALGEPENLPWADGVRYLGWEDGVLVPTTARPVPAAALWRDALAAADGDRLALLPGTAVRFHPSAYRVGLPEGPNPSVQPSVQPPPAGFAEPGDAR